jgi:hypothetical protein
MMYENGHPGMDPVQCPKGSPIARRGSSVEGQGLDGWRRVDMRVSYARAIVRCPADQASAMSRLPPSVEQNLGALREELGLCAR